MEMDKIAEYQESGKYGALRELAAIKMFVERGFIVSIPNMNARYDFIAEKYPHILRMQVKKLVLKKGHAGEQSSHKIWCIRSYSTVYGKRRTYDSMDCDMVVGICLDTGTFAIVPISKISGKSEFRLSTHKDSRGRAYLCSFKAIDDLIHKT